MRVRRSYVLPFTFGNVIYYILINSYHTIRRGRPRGVMVKALACGIVVSEFELQSHYDVWFQINPLGKGMNLVILPAMGYKSIIALLLQR